MAPRRIGYIQDKIAPPRFLAFLAILAVSFAVLIGYYGWQRAFMTAFDIAAVFFVVTTLPLLKLTVADEMKRHARENDVNRLVLLTITLIVSAAIFVSIAFELGEKNPNGALVVGTLAAAWLFANVNFALHYSFAYWIQDGQGGFDFPHTDVPDYADFAYFAFNIGMTFSTADVGLTARDVRLVVMVHGLASYIFNIGALAFSVNVLSSG